MKWAVGTDRSLPINNDASPANTNTWDPTVPRQVGRVVGV